MGWFRTSGGRLIHGEGSLAAVYVERGWEPIDDATAEAEVASLEAQTRADVERDLARQVDEKTRKADEQKDQRRQTPATDLADVGELKVTVNPETPLTPEDEAAVQKALDEEAPR